MRKFLIAFLAIAFLFAGCTVNVGDESDKNKNDNESSSSTEAQNTEKGYTTIPDATNLATPFEDYSRNKIVWGPGNIENHQRPTDPTALESKYSKIGGKWLLNDKKAICLTFDEGYENGYTPSILDTLKEKRVKAIFFVTYDFAKSNPELIKRMIDEGHIVGNHTYRHYTMDEVDLSVAEEEISFLHEYIKKNFNYEMKYFRFPKGEFSEQTLFLAHEMGYTSVFWSFAYADWDTQNVVDTATALNKLTGSTHDGAIFLLHAVSLTNAEILPQAIDDIRAQGYKFTVNIT